MNATKPKRCSARRRNCLEWNNYPPSVRVPYSIPPYSTVRIPRANLTAVLRIGKKLRDGSVQCGMTQRGDQFCQWRQYKAPRRKPWMRHLQLPLVDHAGTIKQDVKI